MVTQEILLLATVCLILICKPSYTQKVVGLKKCQQYTDCDKYWHICYADLNVTDICVDCWGNEDLEACKEINKWIQIGIKIAIGVGVGLAIIVVGCTVMCCLCCACCMCSKGRKGTANNMGPMAPPNGYQPSITPSSSSSPSNPTPPDDPSNPPTYTEKEA